MANIGKWALSGVGLTSVLTDTQLAPGSIGISNGIMSAAGPNYANQTNLDLYVDIEVNLAALTPTAGAYVAIYILESVDGTNFPAQSTADLLLTSTQLLVTIPVGTATTTAQRVTAREIALPPALIQFKLYNATGVALANSGNTVKVLPYNYNLNG